MIDDETKREFEATIGLNLALLKFSGVVSYERGLVNRNVLAGLALFCLTIFSISYVCEFATNLNDVASMLESFSMVIPLVGGQIRFMTVLWFRNSCQAMLNVCEYFWSTLNSYEKEIVRSYTNKAKLLTGFYVAICVLTILLVLLFSLMSNVIVKSRLNFENVTICENASSLSPSEANGERLNATENKRHLPYAFFIDVQKTPWYEVLYVLQITFMTNVGFTCVAADTIGPMFILITCGYFDTIRSRIENLHLLEPSLPITAETRTTDRVESSSDVDTKKLRTCVIHHQLLLKFCKDIQQLMSLVFLIQLFGSTYNISLVGLELVNDTPDKSKFTVVVIIIVQLFICNWPPDLLLSKSEAISHAAYSIPWYQYPCSLRNPMNLLMIRSQRPVRLTAGKFVVLSLETFASMISTAASFFTMMRSVN